MSSSSIVRLGLVLLGLASLAAVMGGSAGVAEEASPQGTTSEAASENIATVADGATGERPNIVLFLTDDQPPYTLNKMPETKERIIEKGLTFEQTFSNCPLCCPGRATIQRGQYSFNHHVMDNSAPDGGWSRFDELEREKNTVATWLDGAGYRTGYFGKYMNEYETSREPPGWDRWHVQSGEFKDNRRVNEDGEIHGYSKTIHQDKYYRRAALRWFGGAVEGPEPVYMHIGFHAAHAPYEYQPRYADLHRSANVPRTPDFNEKNFSDKPYSRPRLTDTQIRKADQRHRDQLRSLRTVDDTVKMTIKMLADKGELDNTYFLFYTDNGAHNGQHRNLKGKLDPYYTDTRFPLLVRGPGVPEGRTTNKLASNNDIAPTIASFARAEIPDFVDGRSLAPLLDSNPANDEPWRTALLSQRGKERWWALAEDGPDGPLTYIERDGGGRELYRLDEDPYEVENAYDSVSKAKKTRLHDRLEAIKGCARERCRIAENGP